MARPLKPLIRGGGYLPSRKWTPLVYNGGYTTMDGAGEPEPPVEWQTVTGVSPLSLANALAHSIKSLTQYGKCVQDGTPTPSAPVDIVCNNGVLKLSPNLLDPSTSNIIIGENINAQGQPLTGANNWRTDYIPVVGGTTYIFYGRRKADNVISAYCRMNFYTADKTAITPRPSYTQDTPTVATAPSDAAYMRLSCAPYNSQNPITRNTFDEFNWMFAEAAQEIPYVPYGVVYADGTPEVLTVSADGAEMQTVTGIPMLLSVDDCTDEGEIIGGIKTGKVGIYVFTGEEAFTKGTAFYTTNTSFLPSKAGKITPMCTHFKGISSYASRVGDSLTMTVNGPSAGGFRGCVYFYADRRLYATAADFQAWLAAQYAAGTPVIVLYPLATETTEQGTPHALTTAQGTNVASVTSNVDPVNLAATYASSED